MTTLPQYTAIHDLETTFRGDTIKAQGFRISTKADADAVPVPIDLDDFSEINMQIRLGGELGKVLFTATKSDLTITDSTTGTFITPQIDNATD